MKLSPSAWIGLVMLAIYLVAGVVGPALAGGLGLAWQVEPLLSLVGPGEVALARPVAAAVSVERLCRWAAWLASAGKPAELEAAVYGWACRLKALDGDRLEEMARESLARKTPAGVEPVGDANATMLDYLRGYMRQVQPGRYGARALDAALAHAVSCAAGKPEPLAAGERPAWRTAREKSRRGGATKRACRSRK